MESKEKISFFKKLKISIFKFEDYAQLAAQKIGQSIIYVLILMIIFALLASIAITYKFSITLGEVKNYINNEIETIQFQDGTLNIVPSKDKDKPIIIENEESPVGSIIIDTRDLSEEEINNYTEQIKGYTNGIVLLKDKIITKTEMSSITTTMFYNDIATQYNIQEISKADIIDMLEGRNVINIYISFYLSMTVYLFLVYFPTVLIDAILLSILAYITSVISRVRLKFSASYNISIYALTLPIILNLAYIIVNTLTGFTIEYFQVMYTAIASIYVIASILIIRSDLIKRQIELNKIMSEQEKIRQEMERKKKEEKEAEERERLKREDEKKRKQKEEEKKEKKEKNKNSGNDEEPAGL